MQKKFIIMILIISIIIPFTTVEADTSYSMTFTQNQKTMYFGSLADAQILHFEISYSTGDYDNLSFAVFDNNGKFIMNGTSGDITNTPGSYAFPLKFVTQSNGQDFRIDLRLSAGSIPTQDNSLLDELKSLDSFLSDPEPLGKAFDHLTNSVNNMMNYGPLGFAKSMGTRIGNMGISPGNYALPKIEVEFFKGHKINVFDLSQFGAEITAIRLLMAATLYFGLFLYLIQYIIPRFKI